MTRFGGPLRWLISSTGQALVETALLLPLLVFGLIGGIDLARAYSAQLAVQNAARAGAEAVALKVVSTDAQIANYVRSELANVPGVNAASATVTVTHTSGAVEYVTVRVQYAWRTLVAWPLVPNQATIDRSTKMRKFT
jgi:Flp pilus assembly protein TadG